MAILIVSAVKGFALGSLLTSFSYVLDRTVSINNYNIAMERLPSLYKTGWNKIITNLCLINPPIYAVVNKLFITDSYNYINPAHLVSVIFIHNLGYYLIHKEFHNNKKLYNIHIFHHKFDQIILPSTGNAVSKREFIIAYVSPIVLAASIIKPNEPTFIMSILLISLFNLLIHCKELRTSKWIPGFVSPDMHITHHEIRNKHFAAPFVNFDELF